MNSHKERFIAILDNRLAMPSKSQNNIPAWFERNSPFYLVYLAVLVLMILIMPSNFVYIVCVIIVDLLVSGIFIALTLFAVEEGALNKVMVSIIYLIPYFLFVYFFYVLAFIGGEKLLSQSTYVRLLIGGNFLMAYEIKKLFSYWKKITGQEYEHLLMSALFKPLLLAGLVLIIAYFVYPLLVYSNLDGNALLRNVCGVLIILIYKIFSEHKN